ncbi:MAG: cytidylyltransferase domain-containing protein [Betaproteobacteria bacterium]
MEIVAFVPAKGSSERIANKNLAILDGEYLFKHKLKQLLKSRRVTRVVLDTEDDQLAALAADLPITRLKRPAELASNATDGHALFAWECSQVRADVYVQALCTAPFVTAETVDRAIDQLLATDEHDAVLAVTGAKLYTWTDGRPDYGIGRIPNSVDLPVTTIEAMSLYAVRASGKAPPARRFGERPLLMELSPQEAIDVNWPEDLALAETIAAGARARDNLALGALSPYLSTAMLSDITRELGMQVALPAQITAASRGCRFFGRAKTLLLDAPREGEDWRGIYDALGSYAFVRPGDVIMVENRVQGHAYFGNLNTQLAMRAGAVGAVIDGMTRDRSEVEALSFPVFARGHTCVDIKFKGVVRSMNMPIAMGHVAVKNGDYVLADGDGVVVIPEEDWWRVREAALKVIEKEWQVGRAVALGVPAGEIFNRLGEF